MSDVVDATDDRAAVVPFDHRDRRVLNLEWEEPAARPPDHAVQRDLDHTAVGDDQHVALVMALVDRLQRSRHACLEERRSLAPGDEVPVRLLLPTRPGLRVPLGDVGRPQSFPLPQVDLAQLRHRGRLRSRCVADELRRLGGSLQVARVEARKPAACQPLTEPGCLAASAVRQRWVELALDPALVVPGRLAMAYKQEAVGGGFGRRRTRLDGRGLLRAREFDLAIYTNFLLIPRSGSGRSQEKAVAVTRHAGRNSPSIATGGRSGRALHRYAYAPKWFRPVDFALLPVRAPLPRTGRRCRRRRRRGQRPQLEQRRVRLRRQSQATRRRERQG